MENNIDLQEQVRRDDVYDRVNKIVDQIGDLGVFPPLVWVWAWDCVRDIYENYEYESAVDSGEYMAVPKGISLKDVWDKFWETADEEGWTLEYGAEEISEHAREWMMDKDFLVDLEDEDE